MSTKLDAMLSEVSSLVASATAVSAKKKPQHAVEKDSKGKFRIRSMKDGKLWPQTYDTKEKANKGLAAYHLRKKGVPPKKTKAAAECPECGAEAKIDMRGMHCPECGYDDHDAELHNRIQDGDEEVVQEMLDEAMSASASASVVSAKLPKLHDDEQHALVQLVGDPADWRGYVRDTKWVLNNADQAFFDKYTRNGYKFFILIDKTAERRSPRSRIAFLVHPDGRVSAFDTNDRAITDGSVDEFIDMVRSKNATMASAKMVKAAEPSMSYDPRDKMYLRKLKKIVDRGYMEAEEVGGAVFEALHKAKVSNRMAGAIAQKVQEALFDAEEDVIDVSAKAKLAAKAKLEAARRK